MPVLLTAIPSSTNNQNGTPEMRAAINKADNDIAKAQASGFNAFARDPCAVAC
jgi:hypothetical protein